MKSIESGVLIDYGLGNLRSVVNAFRAIGCNLDISADAAVIAKAQLLVLPGVGAFAVGMHNLKQRQLTQAIRDSVQRGGLLIGICLGMQLLADWGEEGGQTAGLGLIPGYVTSLDSRGLPLPNIGFRRIVWSKFSLANVLNEDYYFIHSYVFKAENPYVLARTLYGENYPCIVGKDRVIGFQFHPEKSHSNGLILLKNVLNENFTC